jgi:hypothetical protein
MTAAGSGVNVTAGVGQALVTSSDRSGRAETLLSLRPRCVRACGTVREIFEPSAPLSHLTGGLGVGAVGG